MATITITTPAGADARIADAFAAASGWTATLPDGSANPVSKAQNVKAALITYIRRVVELYEVRVAAEAASATAAAGAAGITPT